MTGYLQWFVLSALTGSPIGSAIALIVFWAVVDRFTLGLLPDPLRFLKRRQREWHLSKLLRLAPHDRRARLELAELFVQRGAFARAVDTLKPNLEHGEDDVQTLFIMGSACAGAGYTQQGESFLEHAREKRADFRVGEIDLVLGRTRLKRGDFVAAREALERLVQARKGTVQGRVLLSQALRGAGDDGAAALMRDAAWDEYVHAPRFQRRQERLWAWRARPSRPALYLLIALAVAATLVSLTGAPTDGGEY